ncbi:FecR domain-containing protein [Flavobacterium sp. IMCC34518]|uniref:FecR family protein n=1 Tax=Flavobacterium sp. IMCC34518 TaxID=3003623 RepID=UPI0022ABF413|nr:FecR domain-containing protein [Flavobacterium sp. IMCC34518]
MKKNYLLSKWLNNDLTASELADFKTDPDFENYEKIKKYSAELKVADFDEDAVLKNIISHKKTEPKVIPLYKNWMFKVASIVLIALSITIVVQNFRTQSQLALNGKRTTFSLPDDSEVVLNAGSEIEFRKWNWSHNRKLELQGEAYFKVAKGKKFEVVTHLGKVTVLGTQFNVKARNNRFDITCYEGRVKINYKNLETIITPGKRVTFENGKQINSTLNTTKPEWLENQVSFEHENLRNILEEVQRQYNITIIVKDKLPNELFTGKLPTDNLDVAIKIIATTYHLEPNRITANKIILE